MSWVMTLALIYGTLCGISIFFLTVEFLGLRLMSDRAAVIAIPPNAYQPRGTPLLPQKLIQPELINVDGNGHL